MTGRARFGVDVAGVSLTRFDQFRACTGYLNRSEAFRNLIRARLVEEDVQRPSAHGLGVLSSVYDHRKSEPGEKLTELQRRVPVPDAATCSTCPVHSALSMGTPGARVIRRYPGGGTTFSLILNFQ